MSKRKRQPERGEIHLCQFDPARGSEQAGTRPAVVVERRAFSSVAAKRHVLVAPISGSPKCERLPFCVPAGPGEGTGLRTKSFVNASHLHAFSKDRLIRKLGALPDDTMEHVDEALRLVLDL